ncbi:glycosyltransferase [Amphritea japonica]|nr:glycosyltransferase [Amphritea japonica]
MSEKIINQEHVAVFMHDFRGGGAERVSISLCNELVRHDVKTTIIVVNNKGEMARQISETVNIIELKSMRMATSFWELKNVVKKIKPDKVISHMTHANVTACIASLLGGFREKLFIVEHNQMQRNYEVVRKRSVKLAYLLAKVIYKAPKKIIAVSEGVKDSVCEYTSAKREDVAVVYNPVVTNRILNHVVSEKIELHPYFNDDVPVFVMVGSLTIQKNYSLFLQAFKMFICKQDARAVILGEGEERQKLEAQKELLDLRGKVDFVGFVDNPYDYIANADAFVMSSSWEGLPTVLIEALALGTVVVSTDCKSGPREILDSGKYGYLVDVDDVNALSETMFDALNNANFDIKARSMTFTAEASVKGYFNVIREGA